MTPPALATLARYGARLLALLGAANLALLVQAPHFATLGTEAALVADAILAGGWLVHIATTFADTGTVPANPPMEARWIGTSVSGSVSGPFYSPPSDMVGGNVPPPPPAQPPTAAAPLS